MNESVLHDQVSIDSEGDGPPTKKTKRPSNDGVNTGIKSPL